MLKKILKKRRVERVRKRLEMLGQMLDTIDAGLIKNRFSNDQRLDFWMRFFGDRVYRKELMQEMVEKAKES